MIRQDYRDAALAEVKQLWPQMQWFRASADSYYVHGEYTDLEVNIWTDSHLVDGQEKIRYDVDLIYRNDYLFHDKPFWALSDALNEVWQCYQERRRVEQPLRPPTCLELPEPAAQTDPALLEAAQGVLSLLDEAKQGERRSVGRLLFLSVGGEHPVIARLRAVLKERKS